MSHGCICYILLVVVSIDELNIDSIDGFEKTMPGLHSKPEVRNWSVTVVMYVRCRC
jgi:hypothetical protein